MAGYVEARSLSELNELADNPPQYPVNPAETPRESLTLYISRVPGSRDVILSPLRPQAKNVTGGDVIHSLYYVHLDLPSDERLVVKKPVVERSPQTAIPRKPLPTSAKVPWLENQSPGGATSSPQPIPALAADQKVPALQVPVPGQGHHEAVYDAPVLDLPGPTSSYDSAAVRPLGPRPMTGPAVPPKDNRSSLASPARITPSAPAPPSRGRSPAGFSPSRPSTSDSSHHAAQAPLLGSLSPARPPNRPSSTPYTLTLIRRDPSSGEQKNVARITSFQTNIPTPDMADPNLSLDNMPRAEPPAVHIRIETLGYGKFSNWPTRAALDRFAAEGNLNLRPGESFVDGPGRRSRNTSLSFHTPAAPAEQGFHRQVRMAYAKTWTSNIKSAFHVRQRSHERRHSGAEDLQYPPTAAMEEFVAPRAPAMQGHRRQASAGSTGSAESFGSTAAPGAGAGRPMSAGLALPAGRSSMGGGGDMFGTSPTSPSSPVITRPGPGLKPKGYVFASPWDGRCEFRTGRGGRSLECRHVLGSSSAGFDTATEGHGATGVRAVSELRFNLPGSSEGGGGGPSHGHRHSLHGKFDKLLKLDARHRDSSDDEDGDDSSALDLSLGRERAGGGSKGNRAKLGKLIIHDEGQKMIDLVVAANIGVWWGTWERVSA